MSDIGVKENSCRLEPCVLVVMVDFFKARQLAEALQCLFANDYDKGSIKAIVLDNSVDLRNAELLRKIATTFNLRVEINSKNLGYTKACNQAARFAGSDYILLLNPDVCLRDPTSLGKMVDFLEAHPNAVICGPKQINPDGNIAETARSFPSFTELLQRRLGFSRVFRAVAPGVVTRRSIDHMLCHNVDWLQSSCMLIRRSFWDAVGGLDERYYLFMSDIEICLQARIMQKDVHFLSDVKVYPDGIRASRGGIMALFYSRTFRLHVMDALRYFFRHGLLGKRQLVGKAPCCLSKK